MSHEKKTLLSKHGGLTNHGTGNLSPMFFLLAIDDAPQGFQWPLGATIVHKGLFHVSLLLKQKTAFSVPLS